MDNQENKIIHEGTHPEAQAVCEVFVQMKTLCIFFPRDLKYFRSPVQRAMMLINSQQTLKRSTFQQLEDQWL